MTAPIVSSVTGFVYNMLDENFTAFMSDGDVKQRGQLRIDGSLWERLVEGKRRD